MTVQEAAGTIEALVRERGGGVSFVEIQNALGEESKGDLWIGMSEYNIWWWFGVSNLLVDAMESLKPVIEPSVASVLVYMADGALPSVPVVKSKRRYKTPRWAPIVWNLRATRKDSREIRPTRTRPETQGKSESI